LSDSKEEVGGVSSISVRNIYPKTTGASSSNQPKLPGAPLEKYVISTIDKSYYLQKLILLNTYKANPRGKYEKEVKKREQKFAPSRH
jgi:hypothetical protein